MKFSYEEIELLQSKFSVEEFKPNTIIIKAEQKVSKLYFVKSGLLRTYFLSEGKEINTYFACNNQFITSYSNFITQTPSVQYLEAIDESKIYSITYQDLTDLYEKKQQF